MGIDTKYLSDWRHLDGSSAPPGSPDVVIGHVSDLHGQLGPAHQVYDDNPQNRPPIDFGGEDRVVRPVRGLATIVAKLDALRASHETLVAMSGDTFHGTAETTFSNGEVMLDPINEHVRPDTYVPGNWDFGHEAAADGSALALFDALAAPTLANNLRDATGEQLYDGFRLFERGGVTVGVVGMTNPYVDRMAPAFHEGKYTFGKAPSLLAETADAARESGAEIVVAVTEIGLPWTVQAAKDFSQIDVILSAHTHEYTFEPILIEETGTVVVESGVGEALGRVDVRVDEAGPAFRHVLYAFLEDHEYTPDPDRAARETIERVRAPFFEADPGKRRGPATLDRPLDTVLGRTERALDRHSFLESGWNTLFNDALRAFFDADLAVAHGNRYGRAVPPGEITLGDVYTAYPVTPAVAAGDAWGQQLTAHVESYLIDNFTPYVYDQEDGRVRTVSSNVELTIDPTAKRGRRLVEMLIDGAPVDPDETYRVATYTRPGAPKRDLGGCGFPFREVETRAVAPAAVLADYLATHSPVSPETGTRVRTPETGGWVQNTPSDGPYPFVQPGVDYADGTAYVETAMVPRQFDHPAPGPAPDRRRNR